MMTISIWADHSRVLVILSALAIVCLGLGWKGLGKTGLRAFVSGREKARARVAIYGAGEAGLQLVVALRDSLTVKPVMFVDDSKLRQKMTIFGLPVRDPSDLPRLVNRKNIETIIVAIPSLSKLKRAEILKKLEPLPCKIQILPQRLDIIKNSKALKNFRTIEPEDLLGRSEHKFKIPNLAEPYTGKSILIPGAGGSIGLELCRQVLGFRPRKMVLFEHSEYALYLAKRELSKAAKREGVEIIAVLGSVCDADMVRHVMQVHSTDVVFHAAAYKHVPLVETNVVMGLKNNVLGTHVLAREAVKAGVERFVLISTDKAVRPTNIMGATKRLAEHIIQDCAKQNPKTLFSMVRFGNVLGSSGSVIPLFRNQISKGGPITLTHEDVTRFFMANSEAVYLVFVAGSFASGGDVFVLDMGAPVKIKNLALRMIELSGLTLRDENNPDGDIEIMTTGLRPGEKLYEELLITQDLLSTPHPKILRAKESFLSPADLKTVIGSIQRAVDTQDESAARHIIETWVEGYHRLERDNAISEG